jgi:hypothetical protein
MVEGAICAGERAALPSFFLACAMPARSNDCPGRWIKIGSSGVENRWDTNLSWRAPP